MRHISLRGRIWEEFSIHAALKVLTNKNVNAMNRTR